MKHAPSLLAAALFVLATGAQAQTEAPAPIIPPDNVVQAACAQQPDRCEELKQRKAQLQAKLKAQCEADPAHCEERKASLQQRLTDLRARRKNAQANTAQPSSSQP